MGGAESEGGRELCINNRGTCSGNSRGGNSANIRGNRDEGSVNSKKTNLVEISWGKEQTSSTEEGRCVLGATDTSRSRGRGRRGSVRDT